MITKNITPSVYYTGVDDHTTPLFESLWPLPYGVTYNSYIVKGEATALIDTAELNSYEAYLSNLLNHGIDAPEYLIINHMEPDHSGCIPLLCERFPKMKIVGNRLTVGMIKGYYHIEDDTRYLVVKDGDTLDLGAGRVLSFHTIPMVHWPETMVTWLESEGVLFSGDAFGTFGTTDGNPIDEHLPGIDVFMSEMHRYYACIVAKYADQVQRALTKLADKEIKYICSTHGPVWHKHVAEVIATYNALSTYKVEPGVVIAYGSMYGNTTEMAQLLAERLEAAGITVKLHNMSNTNLSFVLADIWRYNGLIIGAPTYNGAVFPPVAALLSALEGRGLRNHVAAAFGSFTWAGAACKKIAEALAGLSLDMPAAPVEMKMSMNPATRAALIEMADTLVPAILAD